MLNKAFSFLCRGAGSSYGRAVETPLLDYVDAGSADLHAALVPAGCDDYAALRTEQLLQVVMSTPHKTELLAFDPLNTYAYPLDFPWSLSYTATAVAGATVSALDSGGVRLWVADNFTLTVHQSAGTWSSTSQFSGDRSGSFQMMDGLSNTMAVADSLGVVVGGAPSDDPFHTIISCVAPYTWSINDALAAVAALNGRGLPQEWLDKYKAEIVAPRKLAAAALGCLKGMGAF